MSWFSWFATPADESGESTEGGGSNRSVGSSARIEEGQHSPPTASSTRSADTKSSRSQFEGDNQAVEVGAEGGDGRDSDGAVDPGENDDYGDVLLSESTRLKGYITFVVASAIHYESAKNSSNLADDKSDDKSGTDDILGRMGSDNNHVYSASDSQRSYAMAVSMITLIVAIFCIIVHFDRFTCLKKVWIKAFRPKSKIELGLLLSLTVWWLFATWILTSITGIAGAGKGHYNLYFSTWVCLWTCFWTLERWLVAAGHSSVTSFMESWPNRAPAWIVMFILSLASMLSMVDIYTNWGSFEEERNFLYFTYFSVGQRAWEWLIFVPALTVPVSAGFFLIELFRVTKSDRKNTKSDGENMFEGLCIVILTCFWIPSLFIATTPGGAASLVGNAYFFTWGTTIIVTETFLWWVRDWRRGVHDVIRMQQEEYRRAQMLVLKKHKEEIVKAVSIDDVREGVVVDPAGEQNLRVTFLEGSVATPTRK